MADPARYNPPKMKFDTKIWHPNISSQALSLECLEVPLHLGSALSQRSKAPEPYSHILELGIASHSLASKGHALESLKECASVPSPMALATFDGDFSFSQAETLWMVKASKRF